MSRSMQSIADHYTSTEQLASIAWATTRDGQLNDHGYLEAPTEAPTEAVAEQQRRNSAASPADGLKDDIHSSIYRIYSMTKPVVSVAAYLLIEAGKLSLDDPVTRFLPVASQQKVLEKDRRLIDRKNTATIEHLLTHRAGLSYDFLPDCEVADLYREARLANDGHRPLEELCHELCTLPLAYEPGARWQYSYATDLLAYIVELVSETPLDDFLKLRLFKPLGMHDTDFQVRESERWRLKTMYGTKHLSEVLSEEPTPQRLNKLDVDEAYPIDGANGFRRGGIGLYSTLSDYLAFAELLRTGSSTHGGTILDPDSLKKLWTNRLPEHQRPIAIGLNQFPGYGWNLFGRIMVDVNQAEATAVRGEGGWAGAASTYFWVDRQHQTTGVILTQYLGSSVKPGPEMHAAFSTFNQQNS